MAGGVNPKLTAALLEGKRRWPDLKDPEVTWRAGMLPFGEYEDGSTGLAWPQSALDAKNALGRFGRSVDAAMGQPWSPDETFPRPEDAVLPGLAMAGSGLGHLGLRGRVTGSVAGAERAEASRGLPSSSVGAGREMAQRVDALYKQMQGLQEKIQPLSNRVYDSGVAVSERDLAQFKALSAQRDSLQAEWRDLSTRYEALPLADIPEHGPLQVRAYRGAAAEEQWPPPSDNAAHRGMFWGSDDPLVTERYSHRIPAATAPSTTPVDMQFARPLVVDAKGGSWSEIPWTGEAPHISTEKLSQLAKKHGYDGLVVQNVKDGGPPATSYAAIQPGTVKSATTGETLFSNPKDAAPVGVLAASGAREHPVTAATRYGSDVYPRRVHGDEWLDIEKRFGPGAEKASDESVKGFVTNSGRFVDREEGAQMLNALDPRYNKSSAGSEDFMFADGQPRIAGTPGEQQAFSQFHIRGGDIDAALAHETDAIDTLRRILAQPGDGVDRAWLSQNLAKHEAAINTLREMQKAQTQTSGPHMLPSLDGFFANPPDAAPAGLLATGEGEEDDLPPIVRSLLNRNSIGGGW